MESEKIELPNDSLTLPFHLRFYKKTRAIQLKPADDKHIHFSLVWGEKSKLSINDMENMYSEVKKYFELNDWKLKFSLIIARGSCTYGRFDKEFEDLLFSLREKYPLETKKNLPWEDHIGELVPEERPIAFHIAHSASKLMPEFNKFMQSARPDCGKSLFLEISIR